jgi:hypothetical protein
VLHRPPPAWTSHHAQEVGDDHVTAQADGAGVAGGDRVGFFLPAEYRSSGAEPTLHRRRPAAACSSIAGALPIDRVL